jgi:hypothetical protein
MRGDRTKLQFGGVTSRSRTKAGAIPRSAPFDEPDIQRLVNACRVLPVLPHGDEQHDYMTNVLLTVLDLRMHSTTVERSIRHYLDVREVDLRTLDELRTLLGRFPDDKEGNREVSRYLWGNDHWTRVHWLRGFVDFLDGDGLESQEALEAWAASSDYERDFAGRVKYLGAAAYKGLVMRLGVDTVKPDVWIRRFVQETVGHGASDADLVWVVTEVAQRLERSPRELDAAIWEHQRRAPGAV